MFVLFCFQTRISFARSKVMTNLTVCGSTGVCCTSISVQFIKENGSGLIKELLCQVLVCWKKPAVSRLLVGWTVKFRRVRLGLFNAKFASTFIKTVVFIHYQYKSRNVLTSLFTSWRKFTLWYLGNTASQQIPWVGSQSNVIWQTKALSIE